MILMKEGIVMSVCQRCQSDRILDCSAHASDCQSYSMRNCGPEHQGYAPRIKDICGGDELSPSICLDCGQVQGTFPKETPDELVEFSEIDR